MRERKYRTSEWGILLKAKADELRRDITLYEDLLGSAITKALSYSGNVAVAFYDIDGQSGYLYSHSQVNYPTHKIASLDLFVLVNENRVFETLIVDSDGTIGEGFDRFTDSESKKHTR
ncbi:deaminase domain-containing protein [Paenibacillus sp. strain BS8-2]